MTHQHEIREKSKQYYKAHRDEILIKKKAYNKKTHVDCPCGGKYNAGHKQEHFRTKCHQKMSQANE
jgi:hypothetical protein